MKEIAAILSAYTAAVDAGKLLALATVVKVEGSAYRRAGARMLVTEDGEMIGAISGGCLEGDALLKAQNVMWQQQARLVTYDTADEDAGEIGFQLGCEGIIQVLIEPLDANHSVGPMYLLQQAMQDRTAKVLATVYTNLKRNGPQVGTCLLLHESGKLEGQLFSPGLLAALGEEMKKCMLQTDAVNICFEYAGEQVWAMLQPLPPPVKLVIGGAGSDVVPLVAMAQLLGWETVVLDGRPATTNNHRFGASCMVKQVHPQHLLKDIFIDHRTAFVCMSHNYFFDLNLLRASLSMAHFFYGGVLGPQKKFQQMLHDLMQEGLLLPNEWLQKLYGPAGIDAGAETPDEIALSILAEIQTVLTQSCGQHLRTKPMPIHVRNEVQQPISYLP